MRFFNFNYKCECRTLMKFLIFCIIAAIIVCLMIVITTRVAWAVDDNGCRTPTGGVGNCISAFRCTPLIKFVKNTPKPLSTPLKLFLRKYICNLEANKVCCPSNDEFSNEIVERNVFEDKQIRTIIDESEPPLNDFPEKPDVTKHKNFNLLPEDCGYVATEDKIRLGTKAKLNEFPWMALLSYNSENGTQFNCGGTIINNNYILTAAHCIVPEKSLIGVRVGEYQISTDLDCDLEKKNKCLPPVQNLEVEKIIVHEGYTQTPIQDDIGLIRVKGMDLSAINAKPVCLPTTEELRNDDFKRVIVTGWGRVDQFGTQTDFLQKVDMPIVDNTKCKRAYNEESRVQLTSKQMCAGNEQNKDNCKGDSGGPLQVAKYFNSEVRFVQQGVVSFGHRFCGLYGYPGVYMKVASYMKWILDNLEP